MSTQNLQQEFSKRQETFLAHTKNPSLLEGETEHFDVFFQAPAVKDLIAFGAEHNEFLTQIVDTFSSIGSMDLYRGCLTGYLIGLYGESEITSEHTDHALAAFFQRVLTLCEEYMALVCRQIGATIEQLEEDDELADAFYNFPPNTLLETAPEPVKAWMGAGMLSLGLMSRISSSRSLRDLLRQADRIGERCYYLDHYLDTIGFIPNVLNMVEEETVLLLSPHTGKGVEVALREIDSNNLFFTLLQFTLYHENLLQPLGAQSFTYREIIERIARHDPVEEEDWPEQIYESGCFGYYTYPALQPDGSYNEMGTVWGEGTLYEVPKLDGRYVILLTKPNIQRSWGNAFVTSTHSRLQPEVKLIRRLPDEETAQWLNKIRTATNVR
ncbi:MAG: hypothetical protein HFH82_16945 [Lachnospiraceae bacterium]|nr:hypothetical protein [Lachnospiraceae bacterium]